MLTASDTRCGEDDASGDAIVGHLKGAGHDAARRALLPDERRQIADTVTTWAADVNIDAIIVCGGTGVSPRDVTIEAVTPLLAGRLPGFGELFRQLSYEEVGAAAMLSRADAGWIDSSGGRTMVFMLPGSPAAVDLAMRACIAPQLAHLAALCAGDTS